MHNDLPVPATLEQIDSTTTDHHLFTFRPKVAMPVAPGQFYEIGLPGIGAFPVSVCDYPTGELLTSCIRRAGRVTGALYRLKVGDTVWLRGAFGNGFPLERLAGRDVLLIAGGLGMAPLAGLLKALLACRERYGTISVLYGDRDRRALLFIDRLLRWAEAGFINLRLAVDVPTDCPWQATSPQCRVGLVTELLGDLVLRPSLTTAAVCGPPGMYTALLDRLNLAGLAAEQILVTLERRMQCGVGRCCHCVCSGVFVCREGPVFSLAQLRRMGDAV